MAPGWMVTAPTLMPAWGTAFRAAMLSVSGVKATVGALAAAFWLFQRPPPVVPTKTWLPVRSEGSMATEEMRPLTRP